MGRASFYRIEPQHDYADQWVAIVDRQVVAAAGKILKEVEEKAARLTRKPKDQIPVLFIECGAQVY